MHPFKLCSGGWVCSDFLLFLAFPTIQGEAFGSLCGAFPFFGESTNQVLHLDESNFSSCNEPVLALEECITALGFEAGSTHLEGLHARLLQGTSVQ